MRNFLMVCAGLAACSAVVSADIKNQVREKSVDSLQNHVVLDGSHLVREIKNMVTGEVVVPGQGDGTRAVLTDVFDNFFANTAVWGGTVGRLNLLSVDPNTIAPLCTDNLPLTAPYLRFAIDTGTLDCADPNESGRVADVVGAFCTNQEAGDIFGDDHLMDPNLVDPNSIVNIERHRFLWTFSPQRPQQPGKNDLQVHRVLMIDAFDLDNDGCFQVTGGYSISVDWDPNGVRVASAIYTFDLDLSGIGGMDAFGAGFFVYDIDNFAYDTGGNPNFNDPACGTLWEWARGWKVGAPCLPNQMYTVGGEAIADTWVQFNVFNSANFAPDPGDPNQVICAPNSAAAGCDDPNILTYEDVFTDGLLINVAYFSDLPGGQVELSHNLIATFSADLGAAPCPGDCDGDGVVGLSDIILVISNFGNPTAGNCPGGLPGLVEVLSNFGNTCP